VKLPRDVSGARAVKALRRLGFEVENQEGSHIQLSKDNLKVTVVNAKSLAPKTLKSILHQARVSLQQFRDKL
jgi:predicted RNA binding protein YcfA (HicA-like mRNA interferase family)